MAYGRVWGFRQRTACIKWVCKAVRCRRHHNRSRGLGSDDLRPRRFYTPSFRNRQRNFPDSPLTRSCCVAKLTHSEHHSNATCFQVQAVRAPVVSQASGRAGAVCQVQESVLETEAGEGEVVAVTITAVCSLRTDREIALPGWLECVGAFFDCSIVLDWDPAVKWKNDAIEKATTDYVAFLEPWERFHRYIRLMQCSAPPSSREVVQAIMKGGAMPHTALTVTQGNLLTDQGEYLRTILAEQKPDMISLMRRSWRDFAMTKPVRHWNAEPQEFQIVKREMAANPTQIRQVVCRPDYGPFLEDFRAAFQEMK